MRKRILGILLAVVAMVAGGAVAATSAYADTRTPIVFVHGYTGNASNFDFGRTVLAGRGFQSSRMFGFNYDYNGDNIRNAQSLKSYVDNVKRQTGSDTVDIVNHSMGGLVTMWYIKQLGGGPSVRRVASIAGANNGTTFAAACLVYTTCQQMYPGSDFIRTITSGDPTPGPTQYATWYSACDGIIIPYTNTRQTGATNNLVLCQTHIGYLADAVTFGNIATYLAR